MTRSEATNPEMYQRIITVLVPIYAVVIFGWVAGRLGLADEFMLDRLNAFNAKFALPALLFRTIAIANLYDADWGIISASLTLKIITAVIMSAYAWATRGQFGPAAERALVWHSVLTFPNYVVVGGPVLSAIFDPAKVKVYMGLLLLEQVSVHITCVAVVAELLVLKGPPPTRVIAEHSHGALSVHGPPRVTDAEGWAVPMLLRPVTAPDGVNDGTSVVVNRTRRTSLGAAATQELKVRHHGHGAGGEVTASPRMTARAASPPPHDFALLDEDEEKDKTSDVEAPAGAGATGSPRDGAAAGQAQNGEQAHEHSHAPGGGAVEDYTAPGGGVGAMAVLHRVLFILQERLVRSPLVIGAVAGLAVSLAVKGTDRQRRLHQIVDQTFLYLQNCVLGISLFNFGLFAHVNGMISCGWRKLGEILLLRFVASPFLCLAVLMMFGNFPRDDMRLLVLSAAMPQALSSFVVFKEFKIKPEIFSTSMTMGTALCLPITCIWFFLIEVLI